MEIQESQDFTPPKNTVVVIYDNNTTNIQRYVEETPVDFITYICYQFSLFSNEEFNGRPIHISHFTNKGVKTNKYTACIPKKLNDYFGTPEGKEYLKSISVNVVRYIVRRSGKHQKVHGLHVAGNTEELISVLKNLEPDFLRKDSYSVDRPPVDETGRVRDYSIVTFKENKKGSIPRQFIEKLKVLIEDTEIGSRKLRVKWLNKKVFEDFQKGVNKKINIQQTISMEV